jgi:hypothetical protein
MKRTTAALVLMLTLALATSLSVYAAAAADNTGAASAKSDFPLQLTIHVPFAPTAFESAGESHLVYELYLTNFSGSPVNIQRIEVLDADAPTSPIAVISGDNLAEILAPVGGQGKPASIQLGAGGTTIAYMWLNIKDGNRVPVRLSHRVSTDNDAVEGAVVGTHESDLPVFSAPVRGDGWMASDGPSNDRDNHHRRGVLVIDGKPVDPDVTQSTGC